MADRKSFLLRVSQHLVDELNLWAKDDLRSLNAQIEYLLREAVRKRRRRALKNDAAQSPPRDS